MDIKTGFLMDADRYQFDTGMCSAKKGFAQCDTSQDAWYFGIWANPDKRQIVSYAEGDVTVQTADDDAEFVAEIRKAAKFYIDAGYGFKIDPCLSETIKASFKRLGLTDLLH